ncbi:MAG: hypothetical protein ACUVQV_08690 [Dissulfurimicrobium sp.]|uniref:hypothetical protein n=1 Tax=Dissulfurimicrobium sp. TaxID=2022436 RepID=UPI0040492970
MNYVDEDALYWLRRAGCIQISYGVESGSNEIRDLLNKNIGLEDIKRAFALTVSYGILARLYMVALARHGRLFRRQLNLSMRSSRSARFSIYFLCFLERNSMKSLFKKTKITDDIWLNRIEDIMYFETDPRLTSEDIMAFGRRLRAEFHENFIIMLIR